MDADDALQQWRIEEQQRAQLLEEADALEQSIQADVTQVANLLIGHYQHERPPYPDEAAAAMTACMLWAEATRPGAASPALLETAQRLAISVAYARGWFEKDLGCS